MGLTHFLILSKTECSPYLRVARTPKAQLSHSKYTSIHWQWMWLILKLVLDVLQIFSKPTSGFGTGEQHLKLTTIMFQNIFPSIDINSVKLSSCQRIVLLNYDKDTKLIDFRHYSIILQPLGVPQRIRKFVLNHQVPDLRSLQVVSDFVTKAGYGSESELR